MEKSSPYDSPWKELCMVWIWPRRLICGPRGSFDLLSLRIVLDLACHAGQIGPLDRAIDVDDRLRVEVAQRSRLDAALKRCEVAEDLRLLGGAIGGDGKVLQLLQVLHLVLRGLRRRCCS